MYKRMYQLFDFMYERHAIYIRRHRGDPFPWTEDEILMKYKFTNVFRELDTGTIWLRKNVIEPYADHPELFFNIAMYRLYNFIDTAEEIGYLEYYHTDAIMEKMYARKERGEKVFTGAHMITGTLGGDKITQVFGYCLPSLWNNRRLLEPEVGEPLQRAYDRLCGNSPGFGPFISYEVVTDLRHTRYLEMSDDIYTWANPGPGAKRGICRLLGLQVYTAKGGVPSLETRHKYPSSEQCIKYIGILQREIEQYAPKWFPKVEMRDIEHSLCEWDKYERARLGQGKPRSVYHPPQ